MAHKIEIIGQSLVITDVVNGNILLDFPKRDVYYYNKYLQENIIHIYNIQNVNGQGTNLYFNDLTNSLDKDNNPFTKSSFEIFARQNLGFNAASGGSDAVVVKIIYIATNYNDLLTKDTTYLTTGDLSYVENSQGTAWLPGTLGGTFYSKGWYIWAGVAWISDRTDISKELSDIETEQNIQDGLISNNINTINNKQDLLISGINIKTIEGQNLLGSGSIDLTKSDVGLSNVDNTSDLNKPISNATQTALNLKQDTLVSGTNIKTINSSSLLGSGDISVGTVTSVGLTLGTSGTDANINGSPITSSGSITLNLPNASATNRGLLTITDWTTFNNKLSSSNFIDKETPSGLINGINTIFSLTNIPISGSEHIYKNGVLQEVGVGNDYTINNITITFLIAPIVGDKIRVTYRK